MNILYDNRVYFNCILRLFMSSITREQLQRLAKLTALKLSNDELEKILPEMEQIIQFVWQLQEVELNTDEHCKDDCMLEIREWVSTSMSRKVFLENIQHPLTNDMVTIETSTNQKR